MLYTEGGSYLAVMGLVDSSFAWQPTFMQTSRYFSCAQTGWWYIVFETFEAELRYNNGCDVALVTHFSRCTLAIVARVTRLRYLYGRSDVALKVQNGWNCDALAAPEFCSV